MLSSGSSDQLCHSPAVLLWSWVFVVLVYWGLVSLPLSLSLGQGQWSVSWPPALAVSVLWLFADCFSFLQCCLILSVAHWLRIWVLWTATCSILGSGLSPVHCWPSCLSGLCLLKVHVEMRSLLLPPSLVQLQHPAPSAVCSFSVPCLFSFCFFFAGLGEVSLSRWLCLFIPGVAEGKTHKSWHSSVDLHLPSRLELVSGSMGALLLSQYNMAWRSFLWAGGSGYRSFTSSFLVFFYQVWLRCLSKIFDLWSSRCLLLHPICHLRSRINNFKL
jgi:hypothetical protein